MTVHDLEAIGVVARLIEARCAGGNHGFGDVEAGGVEQDRQVDPVRPARVYPSSGAVLHLGIAVHDRVVATSVPLELAGTSASSR